jgi:hypothetical protein
MTAGGTEAKVANQAESDVSCPSTPTPERTLDPGS